MRGHATLGDAANLGQWVQGPAGQREVEVYVPWTLAMDTPGDTAFATATPDGGIDLAEAGLYVVTFTAQFTVGLSFTTQPTNPAEAYAVIANFGADTTLIAADRKSIGTFNGGLVAPAFTISTLLAVSTTRTIAVRVAGGGFLGTFPADAQVSLFGDASWPGNALGLHIAKLEGGSVASAASTVTAAERRFGRR